VIVTIAHSWGDALAYARGPSNAANEVPEESTEVMFVDRVLRTFRVATNWVSIPGSSLIYDSLSLIAENFHKTKFAL
jgi:hypothetical protein